MKNKYKITALVAIFFGLTISCEDFLEEEARGLLTPEVFFQTEAESTLALNGLLAAMGSFNSIYSHNGTDIGVIGRSAIANGWRNSVFDYEVGSNSGPWGGAYTRVKNANLVLSGIEESDLSDDVKAAGISEALFFRASAYLELLVSYGDVPYWRNPIDLDEVTLLGKTDSDIIHAEMVQDLERSLSLGALSTQRWNQNSSRPTEWAVRMLKAYYHIWAEQWEEARIELIAITTESSHSLNDDPAHMFRAGNEYNDEIIYGREFIMGVQNNRTFEQYRPNGAGESAESNAVFDAIGLPVRSSARTMRKSFAASYDENDARRAYSVFDRFTYTDGDLAGTEVEFDWVYIPKRMRAALPVSDPLVPETEPNGQSGEPERLFTIADAYLLLAEAEFMIGGSSANALAALNNIRERTGLPLYTSITLQDIQNERGWELISEGLWGRKRDLIRWGILESTVLAMPAAEAAAGAGQLSISRAQDEADIISAAPVGRFEVFPIPLVDIEKSEFAGGELTQNPIWQ